MMLLNKSPDNQSLLAKRRNRLLGRMTPAEKHIEGLLNEWAIRFSSQKGFFTILGHIIVDFYLPKHGKLCLEIDGPIHERQTGYDARRDAFLINVRGFRVIRITNKHALGLDANGLLKLVTTRSNAE